jgi:replicative DNA helicase
VETTNDLERRQVLAEKGETPGITTGLADLNTLNNGWQAGDLVIIDYLQLVESPESYTHKNRERAVAEISHGLKKVAKTSGIPVILLAQLNRGVENREDKTPWLADLRESGAIEQDADIVIFPWRPCYYDPDATDENGNSLANTLFLEVAKYREGKVGTILTTHNEDLTRFFDFNVKGYREPEAWYNT